MKKILSFCFAFLVVYTSGKTTHNLSKDGVKQLMQDISANVPPGLRLKARKHVPERENSNINLLSEPGYHFCPTWAGGAWCAEGYLCGDGHNGCPYEQCCNDDLDLQICDSVEYTPCFNGSRATVNDTYHCCKTDQICGDGTKCTQNCAKGQCCDFDPSKVAAECGYSEPNEECPSDKLTQACCDAPWDLRGNRLIDNARGDYVTSNQVCLNDEQFGRMETNENGELVYVKDCNYGLNSFEYVCQHEEGAICAMQMNFALDFEVASEEELTGQVITIQFRMTTYECVARECEGDADEDTLEDIIEDMYDQMLGGLNNIKMHIDCDPLPDPYADAGCAGLKMQGSDVKFCESLMRENCTIKTGPDTCGKCMKGYSAPAGGANVACFKSTIVESHGVNGHMESAGIVFITMIVTLVVFGAVVYVLYRRKKKQQTDFLRSGKSQLIKTSSDGTPIVAPPPQHELATPQREDVNLTGPVSEEFAMSADEEALISKVHG